MFLDIHGANATECVTLRPGRFRPLLTWAREHLDALLTVEHLAGRAGMSSRHFIRAFGQPPRRATRAG
jgi:transcriptional regulator GlxA family with amidase domain